MSNEIEIQKAVGGLTFVVPAHIAAAQAALGDGNINQKASVNSLFIGGKQWKMRVNGELRVVEEFNERTQEMEPVQILSLIVLDQSLSGKAYYTTEYDDTKPRAPDCWSADGRRPHASVQSPRGTTCDTCPMNAKGSKPTQRNPDGRACRGQQFLAVLPVKQDMTPSYDFPALRLKIGPTSMFDKWDPASAAQGWLGWRQYTDFLRANRCAWTSSVVTKVRFSGEDFPKVQFKLAGFLSAGDFNKVVARSRTDEVKELIAGWTVQPSQQALGKPLPQDPDDAPDLSTPEWQAKFVAAPVVADPVFSQSGVAAQAAQEKEAARLKAEEALLEAKAARQREDAAAAAARLIAAGEEARAKEKARKIAEAKRLLAEAEAEAEEVAPTAPVAPAPALDPKLYGPPMVEPLVEAKAETPTPKRQTKKAKEEVPPAPPEIPSDLISDKVKDIMAAFK